MELILVTWQ